jgi:FdhE protein
VRIRRAELLATRHPHAADLLHFYARLAGYQQALATEWTGAPWDPPLVLRALPATLNWIETSGPAGLAGKVPTLRDRTPDDWRGTLDRYLAEDLFEAAEAPAAFVIEALLQPLAALCAASAHQPGRAPVPDPQPPIPDSRPPIPNPRSPIPDPRSPIPARCPFCRQRPAAGVLRDAGQGTRRALVCGLCFTEWSFERIACPSCGERQFDALPVYTAEQAEGVRIEGCDTCGVYLKTIDASKDGTVVPVVDDLATIPLDLWAREHGYRRLRPGFYV